MRIETGLGVDTAYQFPYPFPSSLALKLQTKILFLIFPALVRALFGQRSPAPAANGEIFLFFLSVPHTAPRPQPDSSYLPSFTVATSRR